MSKRGRSITHLRRGHQQMPDHRAHPTKPFVAFARKDIEGSIPQRFEQQVATYPARLAVRTRHHTLTYEALNQTANRIARAIMAKCHSGAEPIALVLDSDASMVAAMLGVLKAGKFYVPLDPSLPGARSAYILEDAQVGLLVTDTMHFSLATTLTPTTLPLLNIDELDSGLSDQNIGLGVSPDTPTWILYTSGSTGQPKGVIQNHRNVLHFTMNYTNGFHIGAPDRLTFLYSMSVNAGAHDIFSALLNGAALYPLHVKEEGLGGLTDWLVEHQSTILGSVPTVFRHFCETLNGAEHFPKLRLIKMIGEPVSRREVELYKRHFADGCLFVNRLGSTETGSIRWYFINKQTHLDGTHVPVGYAVEDNDILLLNDAGEPVRNNEVGEIAVKSRYLSPGYWRQPERTAAVFCADPAGGTERIYRTGDLGRMRPDGCLVCLGRKDFQVKIRGHRIEVDEIEMALREHQAITDVVVMARQDEPGEQRLVAYLTVKGQPTPTVTTLRRLLAEKLPDYMIPAAFIMVDALPLAPNGKVNRRALPAPGRARPELEATYQAPRTALEHVLAALWGNILNLDQVGIHDNFLELGGNSLLATQVISRVLETLQVELPLRLLFESPTVADMAAVVTRSEPAEAVQEHLDSVLAELAQLSDEQVTSQLTPET